MESSCSYRAFVRVTVEDEAYCAVKCMTGLDDPTVDALSPNQGDCDVGFCFVKSLLVRTRLGFPIISRPFPFPLNVRFDPGPRRSDALLPWTGITLSVSCKLTPDPSLKLFNPFGVPLRGEPSPECRPDDANEGRLDGTGRRKRAKGPGKPWISRRSTVIPDSFW